MTDCLFCRIVKKEIPCRMVYEDETILAFEDIHPQAPVHILVIPKKHTDSLAGLQDGDAPMVAALMSITTRIAREKNIIKSGYRTVINTGPDGGQTVPHLHLHLLGGRPLGWPPG